MGDVRRKHNRYSRPRKAFDAVRIAEEEGVVKKYGLRNKKEIWKAEARVSDLRTRAKKLIPKSEEEKEEFFARLSALGLKATNIAEVLALTTEDWLSRRLQTVVFQRGLAKTPLEARQLITHKNVIVDGRIVNVPSFVVTKDLETKISLKARKAKAPKAEAKTE